MKISELLLESREVVDGQSFTHSSDQGLIIRP